MYVMFDDGEQAPWQIAEWVERSPQQLRAADSGSAACSHRRWVSKICSTSEVFHGYEVRSAAAVLHSEPLSPGVLTVAACCSLNSVELCCTQQVPVDVFMR